MSLLRPNLRVNGLDFNIRDIGSRDPALVFIHYWGGTGRTWDLVAKPLSGHHRCVAPDLRGWGGSDKTATNYDLHTQADDVAAIIQSLGLSQYILVGQSMGGKIAQILGSRRPAGLKGLVLVAPAPPTPIGAPKAQRDGMLNSYQSAAGVEMALSILTARQLSPELRQQVVDDTLGGSPGANSAWTQEGMTLDITGLVDKINVPVTVIVGDADKVETEPLLRRELGSRIPGTEFIILPGVGHLSPLEAPGELAAAIMKAVSRMN
jgi:pimeloyl-ACP methyl ester carboxylesterase